MNKGTTAVRWRVGERVATPNGFVGEIVNLTEGRALIRYLTTPPGLGVAELPFDLLRPATADDLLRAGSANSLVDQWHFTGRMKKTE